MIEMVRIAVGSLTLALPLRDLASLEPVLDVIGERSLPRAVGSIELRSGNCPVFCIDEQLTTRTEIPPDHRVCAILDGGAAGLFGIVTSSAQLMDKDGQMTFAVPASMRLTASPLNALTLDERRVACCTTGARLASFLGLGDTSCAADATCLTELEVAAS